MPQEEHSHFFINPFHFLLFFTMVNVCLTCGDEGIRNALIYCENCQIYAVHRYCLFLLPKNLNGAVIWFCEDCELERDVKSSSLGQCGLESMGCVEERNKSVVLSVEKKDDTGYLLSKEDGHSLENCSLRQSSNACCSEIVEDDRPFVKQVNLDDDFSADSGQKDRGNNGVRSGDCDNEPEFRKTAQGQSLVLYALRDANQICSASQPMQEPIWRGSINISNKKIATFDGLVAHLSTLACTRVQEQARMLPELLSPDMLPRSAVWPKSFAKSPPSYDSVGLYIFSDNKRSEKAFGNLVLEMTHQDLALKGVVQNTEILIFTSTLLPMDYWRFHGKLYLWGLFKKKKTTCVASDHVLEEKAGLEKPVILLSHCPVSTLINSNPGGRLMNSPSG